MPDHRPTDAQSPQRPHAWLWRLRFILWAIVAVALVAGGVVAAKVLLQDRQQLAGESISIDGPFRLTSHDGRTVTEAEFRGKVTAWFFGFTHCPDICPTTLSEFTSLLRELGPNADAFTPVFVTVDPERDTQEVLAEYMQAFDPRIAALTGTQKEIDIVVQNLKAYYRKQPLDGGGYSMDHTSTVYLMDRSGEFQSTLDFHEDADTRLAKVKRLLAS